VAPALRADLRVVGDDFTLHFWSEDDRAGKRVGHADASSVVRAWQRGESLVPLLEGGFAPLPADWLHRFGERIADLLAAREAAGGANRLPRSALPDLARLCAELEQPAPPGFERLRTLVDDFTGISAAALPEDLTATLRSYQRTGIDWLSFLRDAELGALLADDMGLGKTLQVLCALRGRCLVVVPTSVLHGWAEQMRRFRPALSFATYHGPGRCLDSAAEVTLTTYAILRLDIEQLATVPWDAVVLDEAQAIKNSDSQVAQAAYRLRARFRVAMTGTPVENRLDELWSQLHFVNRGLLGGRSDFQNRLVKPIVEGDVQAAARLREKTRPFVLRRLKREVAPELPPRTEVVLRCELNASEAQLYQSIWAATRQDVVERLRAGGSVMAALEALLRLRQAACHPALLPGQQAATSSKVELLLETLERTLAGGHKSLVFSQWTTYLDLIEPHLQRLGVPYGRLDGATRDREAVVQAFQAASGPPLLLVSLRAGGTGLNLTAADHVFLLDPWWNPAVEDQAADRAHRIGQDKPVMVYKLVAEQTVEERILELQQTKRAVAELAVGEAAPSAGLTRDDLLAMLA
ncbi:MAG: DEAD/DEAH box helicase, partial [Polyangiaceae bacterium]|nr:DEAD/DEAH box helicase [Polyangiaceae bacterium]